MALSDEEFWRLIEGLGGRADDPAAPTIELIGDSFEYLLAAVVAAGRQTYEAVLADPSWLAGEWDYADAESLLYVAPEAFEEITDGAWEDPTEESEDDNDRPARVDFIGGGPVARRSERYQDWIEDDAWTQWWAAAEAGDLQVITDLDAPALAYPMRRGKTRVHAEIKRPYKSFDGAEPKELAPTDVLAFLTAVQRKFKLGPLPPLPPADEIIATRR